LPTQAGHHVLLSRDLDEFVEGTWAVVTEADELIDSYQLQVRSDDGSCAHIEARREDFLLVVQFPRPAGDGDGLGYSSGERDIGRNYGLTRDEYHGLRDLQGDQCPICDRHAEEIRQPLQVDHNPMTSAVRGLACPTCNRGLGLFGHDVGRLERAYEYLWERSCWATMLEDPFEAPFIERVRVPQHLYDQLLAEQNGRCAICPSAGDLTRQRPLDTDHNHYGGRLRGLLCPPCNRGLGLFDENPHTLQKAVLYLEKSHGLTEAST